MTHPVIKYIWKSVYEENESMVIVVIGPTGSGKSYAGLELANILDPTFVKSPLNERIAFKALEFMRNVDYLCKGESKGKVVIWDEFGVEHNAREFMKLANRLVNFFFQTTRFTNMIMIMTVPYLSFIDGATRKLCNAFAEMVKKDKKTNTSTFKLKFNQVNAMTGKEYPKYFRIRHNGHKFVYKKLRIPLPPKVTIDQYEPLHSRYKTNLRQEIIQKLEIKENKEKAEDLKPLTELQQKIMGCLEQYITKHQDIADKIGAKREVVSKNLQYMRNKGYSVDFARKKENAPIVPTPEVSSI